MNLLYRLLCVSTNLYLSTSFAQSGDSLRKAVLQAEIGGYFVSGQQMPFWARANQDGIVPLAGSIGTIRLMAKADYRPLAPKRRRLDWGYGVEVVANQGATTQLILPEAYAKLRFGALEIYAGRRRGIAGLVDTLLTSGAYAWSGNALPLPKIQIGTIGYAPLGFTKGFVAINAFFNHGWFNNGFVQHSYLHQKVFYIRLGKPNSRVKLYGGGNHEVQWGGYAPGLIGLKGLSDNMDGQLASNLDAYFRVVTASRGTGYVPSTGPISIDEGNRIGNHLGSLDVAIEVKVSGYTLTLYRQNLYETGALFYLTNLVDGLNGLRIQRTQPGSGRFCIDHLLVEFFYSKSQGGSEFVIDDPHRRGRNNYFNHSQYQDGWTYLGRTIGTPFFTQGTEIKASLAQGAIVNNRVSLLHLGASGTLLQRIQWLAKLSYSQNFGTYDNPLPAGTNQFSGLLNTSTPVVIPLVGPCQLQASLTVDQGRLLNNSTALFLSLRKAITTSSGPGQPIKSPNRWPGLN